MINGFDAKASLGKGRINVNNSNIKVVKGDKGDKGDTVT